MHLKKLSVRRTGGQEGRGGGDVLDEVACWRAATAGAVQQKRTVHRKWRSRFFPGDAVSAATSFTFFEQPFEEIHLRK